MNYTILVTGAAGFIGSHLCEKLLSLDHEVIGIDNFDPFYDRKIKEQNLNVSSKHAGFTFIEGDAGNKILLNKISSKIDIVVHLAAKAGVQPSLKDPQGYIHANIIVTNVLLEWMKEKDIRKFVFASSSSVYGNNAKLPFEETDAVDEPISPYAFTKRSCELMNYAYHSLYGFDVFNLRFFTVYGERQRPDLAIHKFVHQIFTGKPIRMYGSGNTARDYTYYADTVNGIVAAIDYTIQQTAFYHIINLGNSIPVKLIDLIVAIGEAIGREPQIIIDNEKPGDVEITYADIQRAKKLIDYEPATNLKTGLKNFVEWYKMRQV
jgi:nucleoside-diphosphate-sugar epimerase